MSDDDNAMLDAMQGRIKETFSTLRTPHVATFPDGTRVNLPVGTVLEEGQSEEAWTLEGRPFASLAALNPTR